MPKQRWPLCRFAPVFCVVGPADPLFLVPCRGRPSNVTGITALDRHSSIKFRCPDCKKSDWRNHMHHSARVVLCLLSFLSGVSLIAADSPALKSAKALKGQQFVLRAHEDQFGSPELSGWDGRLLYETKVSMANGRTQIGGDADWQGMYFVSGNTYELKDASVRDGALQLPPAQSRVS